MKFYSLTWTFICVKILNQGSDDMFLLPFIMEYEGPLNSKLVKEKKENTKKLNFYDYIYLMNGNELLKFKVELNHMDVVNALEDYINTQDQYKKVIMSEKEAQKTNIPLKFFYYLGKYKLENNKLKTKNYLVPKQTIFLEYLTEKYKDEVVSHEDLCNLSELKEDAIEYEEDIELKLIDGLFDNIDIELVDKYVITESEIDNTIINIENLLDNEEAAVVLHKLKWMLESANDNKNNIATLGLQEKFNSAIEKEKVKIK